MKFYRTLGSLLFGAAEPELRYRTFERFYRLPQDLIERFYAGRSTRLDRARIEVFAVENLEETLDITLRRPHAASVGSSS